MSEKIQPCFHCSLPVPPHDDVVAEIQGIPQHFCCTGCKSVCQAIYDAGLEGFYQRTPEGACLAPPPEVPKELALYDLDEVQEEFVGDLGEERSIHLLIEGIHCAACVWLIEHTLNAMPGIVSAQVNLSGKRLVVVGGTGLYYRTLVSGMVAAPPRDPDLRSNGITVVSRFPR